MTSLPFKILTVFFSLFVLCFAFISRAQAASCFDLSSGDVTAIDLNGKTMWFHLTADVYQTLENAKTETQSCIRIGGRQYGVEHVKDGGIALLEMKRPDIRDLHFVVASLSGS